MADLEEIIRTELTKSGFPPNACDDRDTIIFRYLNWRKRIPNPKYWHLEVSSTLKKKSLSQEIRNGLDLFQEHARNGLPIWPHVSRKILDPDYDDKMITHWRIWHFHLGTTIESGDFVRRTNELLFVFPDESASTMYLLDICPHRGGFVNQDLFGILESNWPTVLDPYTLQGIHMPQAIADETVVQYRNANATLAIKTPGGRVLIPPGGGVTLGGFASSAIDEIGRIIHQVKCFENIVKNNRLSLETRFHEKVNIEWKDLRFRLLTFGQLITVIEEFSKEIIFIYEWDMNNSCYQQTEKKEHREYVERFIALL